MKEQTPVLSIGIIFKNEIRCLERCLKSLQPLRKAVSCELVMADTGSTDGSREIAERYADILFDFPWINDFSAAPASGIFPLMPTSGWMRMSARWQTFSPTAQRNTTTCVG